jgi:hypothetical protein
MKLAEEQFNKPGSIDLFGADLFDEMSRPGRYTHPGNFPVLQETVFGWTLSGRTPATTNPNNTTLEEVKCAFLRETSKLEYIIKHFWEVKPADQPTMTVRQKACEEYLHTHNPTEGRGVNRRPIKIDPTHLGKSRLSAERKPSITGIKFGRGPKLKVQDHNFMKKCVETRHKMSVRFQEGNKTHYFLPHHPVSMETGSTTRNQIASGGSSKPSCIQQQSVLLVDRFFHCTDMDTRSIKQMENICRQQSHHHTRRNSFSNLETCANSIQSC